MYTSGTRLFVCLCLTLVVLVAAEEIGAKEEEIETSRVANIDGVDQAVKRMARASDANEETTKDTIDFNIDILNECHDFLFDRINHLRKALDCTNCTATYDECFKVDAAVTKRVSAQLYCQVFKDEPAFKNCVKKNRLCYDETVEGGWHHYKKTKYERVQYVACAKGRNATFYNVEAQLSKGCYNGIYECYRTTALNISKSKTGIDLRDEKLDMCGIHARKRVLIGTHRIDMPGCLRTNGCTETEVQGLTCKINSSQMKKKNPEMKMEASTQEMEKENSTMENEKNGNTSKHGNISGVLVWITCMMTCLFVICG